ncbi:pulmonary surfactant-associated protein C-like [Rhineura floridana]|uniref:pulmonary surfactant-associated protein C-like n=1 Tax=Rhineura floridana TaxID=261503 RepID=UPI002AC861D9|nr:pulmonary surfactant-associated protein C-like [Rhineura floridana]
MGKSSKAEDLLRIQKVPGLIPDTSSCDCCCPPSCDCCCQLCCFLPRLLCRLPKLPSCPVHIKRLLIVVVIIVLIVVVIVGALLMGLYITQAHTETVLQMTIKGLEGGESQLNLPMDIEEVATFCINDRINDPATVIYDFSKMLIGYKPWHRHACYISKMDKGNIQGMDTILKEFQVRPGVLLTAEEVEEASLPSLVDRSSLGTTLNILCSHVPIFQA